MGIPLPHSPSDTMRLMVNAPGYAVGWQVPVYLPDPAAGAGWSYKVDGRYYERVIAVTFTFNADGVVANRLMVLQLLDQDGRVIIEAQCGNPVAAGSFLTVNLVSDGPGYDTGGAGHSYGYVPGFLVPPGWSWSLFTESFDAGDQITDVVLLVQRFPSDTVEISTVS